MDRSEQCKAEKEKMSRLFQIKKIGKSIRLKDKGKKATKNKEKRKSKKN